LILRIAVPSPLFSLFDYLPPVQLPSGGLHAGMRIRVPFGRARTVGVLMEIAATTDVPRAKLRTALEVLDQVSLLDPETIALARWASDYYHHPVGEVVCNILPPYLRQGHAAQLPATRVWKLTTAGRQVNIESLTRAPKQQSVLARLADRQAGVVEATLLAETDCTRAVLKTLHARNWITVHEQQVQPVSERPTNGTGLKLNAAQQHAVSDIASHLGHFQSFLLDGVTGSGKTEVYFQAIEQVIKRGRQTLFLVPEIGLTPQLIHRVKERFDVPMAVMHSGLSDKERATAWLQARNGQAAVILGTRSAVFTPLADAGLIVVDEEHDLSFKQQEGFRYSARDVAVMRARRAEIPIVLGSATPSLESLHNALSGRYRHLPLPKRAGKARPPDIHILDVRGQSMKHSLSGPLIQKIHQHLAANGQVLLFLNRRGYAPALLCHQCGWLAECPRCDARLTLHKHDHTLRCHHCDTRRPVNRECPECGSSELISLGKGTERIDETVQEMFPGVGVIRVDRDTTRRKGTMADLLERVKRGEGQILIGTQMLAKGHHFPGITLVALLDVDQGLFATDFRASERMAQLIMQVAGRAGRDEQRGEVILQTHHPDNPLLHLLLEKGYGAFARAALEEREHAQLPPYTSIALLRAEATAAELPEQFLNDAKNLNESTPNRVQMLGPVPAPMARRAGRYRSHLLIQANRRADLQRMLSDWTPRLDKLKSARKVRWSLDVDAQDLM
jgi:primosomal protein N' (replication factor Y)